MTEKYITKTKVMYIVHKNQQHNNTQICMELKKQHHNS